MMKQVATVLMLCALVVLSVHGWCGDVEVTPVSPWEEMVNLEIKDQPLSDALEMLFRDTDISCRVDPEIASLTVTAVLKNVSRKAAFQEIIEGAGANWASLMGVVHVTPGQARDDDMAVELERKLVDLYAQVAMELRSKKEEHADVQNLRAAIAALEKRLAEERELAAQRSTTTGPLSPVDGTRDQASTTRVFTIRYINPAELAPLIYALGARQVSVVSGGKLVVNAAEDVLAQTATIVKELDTEEALPRPVTVMIRATYQVTDEAGKTESLGSSTSGTVAEGQPIKLSTVASPRNDQFLLGLLLDIQLLPEVGAGDQVTLVGTVALLAPEKPEIKIADTPVAVTVKSGSGAMISEGSIDISGGKLEFEIRAEVTVGKERLKTKSKGSGLGGGFMGGMPGSMGGSGGGA